MTLHEKPSAQPDGSNASRRIVAALEAAATTLPASQLSQLAHALEGQPGPTPSARRAAWDVVPNGRFRQHVAEIFAAWVSDAPQLSGEAVALALRTAHAAAARLRSLVDVDIAWTGPASYLVPVRRTREVLFDVIDAATQALILVSFAAYKVPAVVARLKAASGRGVDIRLVLDTKEDSHGALSFDASAAFSALGELVTLYVWPGELRPNTASGKAALHAKLALADDRMAFITSANLTGAAQTNNMELGTVITGGPVPQRLAAHFTALMSQGILRPALVGDTENGPTAAT